MTDADEPDIPVSTDPGRVDEFVAIFTRHSSWLRGYVATLVPNWADAEEVLQNTNTVLWKKFNQFTPGSNFFAWACQIARHEVMHYRRTKGRERLRFGDEFVEAVAQEVEAMSGDFEHMRQALAHCLSVLPEKDRRVIEERYREGATTRSTAETLGRSIKAICRALGRTRVTLLKCIERELGKEIPL